MIDLTYAPYSKVWVLSFQGEIIHESTSPNLSKVMELTKILHYLHDLKWVFEISGSCVFVRDSLDSLWVYDVNQRLMFPNGTRCTTLDGLKDILRNRDIERPPPVGHGWVRKDMCFVLGEFWSAWPSNNDTWSYSFNNTKAYLSFNDLTQEQWDTINVALKKVF